MWPNNRIMADGKCVLIVLETVTHIPIKYRIYLPRCGLSNVMKSRFHFYQWPSNRVNETLKIIFPISHRITTTNKFLVICNEFELWAWRILLIRLW